MTTLENARHQIRIHGLAEAARRAGAEVRQLEGQTWFIFSNSPAHRAIFTAMEEIKNSLEAIETFLKGSAQPEHRKENRT